MKKFLSLILALTMAAGLAGLRQWADALRLPRNGRAPEFRC